MESILRGFASRSRTEETQRRTASMATPKQTELPEPVDLSHHLSRSTKSREASNIKQFYKYFSIPGIGQLAGGLPNHDYFPYDTLEARVALPSRWKPTPNKPVDPPSPADSHQNPASAHLIIPKTSTATDVLKKIDLDSALQYGTAQGYPPLYAFIREFALQHQHPTIPYKGGAEIILTCGSTDGFAKAVQCLSNEWSEGRDPVEEREGMLVEEYCYMNAIQTARPRGLAIVPVKIDDEGMLASGPGGLADVLENWDSSKGKKPHLMYTVTIGQNPTSGTLSVARRKAIYALCAKHDVIIIEDDPYWYLQYPSSSSPTTTAAPTPAKSSGFPFLDSLVPSYLSIDTQGRVLRLDTFSKTIAPGCRLGWITAQPRLIERILRITETSTQQPSGFVQSMVAELILGPGGPGSKSNPGRGGAKDGTGWQIAGWVRWLEGLRGNYERRMNRMADILSAGQYALSDYPTADATEAEDWALVSKTPIYSFIRPLGGMFIWLRFHFSTHPLAGRVPGPRLARALWILWTTKPYLVLVSPGTIFAPNQEIREADGWRCFRLCFAACDEEQLGPISERFVQGAQAFWKIKDKREIDKLLEDDNPGAAEVDDVNGMAVMTGFC
ncbi:hypothetical protein H2201_005204 [Coniosporium apollinis]|uniref:Aminotransferase class I/classII large domain-containing protein n=1 Tax=Coniosporium apollinis TaxID=61459 RepID=A0ABQ9NS11_9PEZI|nr:hypothetical protein H2201_005204 [Coniosporium apollinis]